MIDISRLENVKHNGDGSIQSRCPACYHLFGRDKTGNHLKVYQDKRYNCVAYSSDSEHNKIIHQLVGVGSDGNIDFYCEPPNPLVKDPEYYPEELLNKLIRDYSYWINRGIDVATLDQFEGGIAGTGKLNHRYVLILRDKLNRIIGFSARYIYDIKPNSGIVRWKNLGKKNLAIFPSFATPYIKEKSEVILVEGGGCALALSNAGIKNVLSIFGTVISQTVIGHLISLNVKKIIIATNNETSGIGNEAALKAKEKLSLFFNPEYVTIQLPTKKDFMEMDKQSIIDWYGKAK